MRFLVIWFIAGCIGVLAGHQIVLMLLHNAGIAPFAPFPMQPVEPLGVPQLVSLTFWGGIWGILLGAITPWFGRGPKYWVLVAIFGAILPTLVAVVVVFPMKGIAPGGDPINGLITGLAVNAAWGLVTAAARKALR
ncbi:MAG: hypothetical protein P1U65_14410 [Minwuia sp.]|nr:hypothetical protein [Minwuia sp.]